METATSMRNSHVVLTRRKKEVEILKMETFKIISQNVRSLVNLGRLAMYEEQMDEEIADIFLA